VDTCGQSPFGGYYGRASEDGKLRIERRHDPKPQLVPRGLGLVAGTVQATPCRCLGEDRRRALAQLAERGRLRLAGCTRDRVDPGACRNRLAKKSLT
jgi:hypothetical protein